MTLISPQLLFPIEAPLIIFLLWVLWTIAISLKGMNESFKEIARKFRDQNQ